MVGWTYIGLIAAWVFIVIQMILLIDFAHSWTESWVAKVEDGSKCHGVGMSSIHDVTAGVLISSSGLVICSIGLYIATLVGIILMFVFYTNKEGEECGLNKFFISVDLVLCVVATILSIHPKVQERIPTSGLLQSGVISAYITYLTWSAVSGATGM